MSLVGVVKRKRGRPRQTVEDPDRATADLRLIEEYRKCPGLYDRNHVQYKEKQYVDEKWQEISQKLKQSVTTLKERYNQLRCRFLIEKRRTDLSRSKARHNGGRIYQSNWPLFKHLTFLDQHIRSRFSHNNEGGRSARGDDESSMSGNRQSATSSNHDSRLASPYTVTRSQTRPQRQAAARALSASQNMASLRALPSGRRVPPSYNGVLASTPKSRDCNDRNEKYRAFGDFLSNALLELPELKALKLIKQFSNEIIEVKMQEEESKIAMKAGNGSQNDQFAGNGHAEVEQQVPNGEDSDLSDTSEFRGTF